MQFDRVISLIGKDKFDLINSKKVLVVGCGGVGGYAIEALIRTGIKNIDVIDNDIIDITNLNRQIITNLNNIGLSKTDVLKKHALSINDKLNINAYNIFLDKTNIDKIINNNYDYIIDACDTVDTKILLMNYSLNNNFKLISCMGTAKKLDPSKLCITTLDKTNYDPLAKAIRKKINKENLKKINVVSSCEKIIKCENLGSLMFVPATAGILCAKYVIDDILK